MNQRTKSQLQYGKPARRIRTILAALGFAGLSVGWLATPHTALAQSDEPHLAAAKSIFLGLKTCKVSHRPKTRVAFVGFDPDDLSLDETVGSEIRQRTEAHLARLIAESSAPYHLVPIRDMDKMLSLMRDLGLSGSGNRESKSQPSAPFDLAVFAQGQRNGRRFHASFTVQRVGEPCSYPAGRHHFGIVSAPVHLPDKVMRRTAYEFFRRAQKVGGILIVPTEFGGQLAPRELARRLERKLEAALIKGVRGEGISFGEDKKINIGSVKNFRGSDTVKNGLWRAQLILERSSLDPKATEMTLKFEHPEYSPYVWTFPVDVGDMERASKESAFFLEPTNKPFVSGQRLGFKIHVRKPLKLYCLLRFNSGRAVVVYPTFRTFKKENRFRTHQFGPRDRHYAFPSKRMIGFRRFKLTRPASHYLHCYGARKRINDELHRAWLNFSPRYRIGKKLRADLDHETTRKLMRRFENHGDVEEQYVEIKIVKKD